ncbi:MAG TPA: riboflavin biosynthesis protein RibF [Clostridiales bacterium]|nr:riboflavin biosynthesis protein RibF [Clostridiales bacterium]
MNVFDLENVKDQNAGIIAFGFFDCIHLGHRQVIQKAVSLAKQQGEPSSVFLFKNNIFPLIGIEKHPIFTFEERLRFIEELQVDNVFYIDADKSFLSLSPQGFLDYLKGRLVIKGFTCGEDFSFGQNGQGKPADLLRAFGNTSAILDLCMSNREKVSSERVKRALSEGDIACAEKLLGRHFTLHRTVAMGRKDGAKMGFPTINFSMDMLRLKKGVYFTEVQLDGKTFRSITNVGEHPTFGDYSCNIETYVLDFAGDLYGKEVALTFLKYHREIRTFAGVDALVAQISQDVNARRDYD